MISSKFCFLTRQILFTARSSCSRKSFSSLEGYLDPRRRKLYKEHLITLSDQLCEWVKKEPSEPDWGQLREKYIQENPLFFNKFNFEVQFMQYLTNSKEKDPRVIDSFSKHVENMLAKKPNKVILAHFLVFLLDRHRHFDLEKLKKFMEELIKDEKFCKYPAVGNAWANYSKVSREACRQAIEFFQKYPSSAWDWESLVTSCITFGYLNEGFKIFLEKIETPSDQLISHAMEMLPNYPNYYFDFVELLQEKRAHLPIYLEKILVSSLNRLNFDPVETKVDNGTCTSCGSKLITFDNDECEKLRNHMKEKVLLPQGNPYIKTTPEELQSFFKLLEEHKEEPFDLIVDSLNCSYWAAERILKRDEKSKRIVVENLGLKERLWEMLSKCGILENFKKVLLVGRKHMNSWSSMEKLKERPGTFSFLLNNTSDDDAFLIYAALQHPNTMLVTQDYYTDHSLDLDRNMALLFRKWKFCRTIRFRHKDKSMTIYPQGVDYIPQINESRIAHFPLNRNLSVDKNESFVPKWYCVKPK